MTDRTPLLALTPGEPAGIGPECTLRLALEHPELRLLAVADRHMLSAVAQNMGVDVAIRDWQPGDTVNAGELACYQHDLNAEFQTGNLNPANAGYVINTIKSAVRIVREGHAGALVTGPVHKGVINDAGIRFSGHTELLAELGGVKKVVMMLACAGLRVALVTTHLPLRKVADAITRDNVRATIRITHAALRQHFGIEDPVIQVLGLNPHAGEGGHLGTEDDLVIRKVVEEFCKKGVRAVGPVPADTAFTQARLKGCDAVVAMYHDQGLPVLKHASFGDAVNITLGLPFIRTSVDHGTALDIAAQFRADASSMATAAKTAQEMCR
jgi:4-hydroxythreonine-4-phosphate dehydrogenase